MLRMNMTEKECIEQQHVLNEKLQNIKEQAVELSLVRGLYVLKNNVPQDVEVSIWIEKEYGEQFLLCSVRGEDGQFLGDEVTNVIATQEVIEMLEVDRVEFNNTVSGREEFIRFMLGKKAEAWIKFQQVSDLHERLEDNLEVKTNKSKGFKV